MKASSQNDAWHTPSIMLPVLAMVLTLLLSCAEQNTQPSTTSSTKATNPTLTNTSTPASTQIPPTQTESSTVVTVQHARGKCTSDVCYNLNPPNRHACATCAILSVTLPPRSQAQAIRCLTTAEGPPGDVPIRVVPCAPLDAWATFDRPTQDVAPDNSVVVRVLFHNRSHNRDRQIQMQVDYTAGQVIRPPSGTKKQ